MIPQSAERWRGDTVERHWCFLVPGGYDDDAHLCTSRSRCASVRRFHAPPRVLMQPRGECACAPYRRCGSTIVDPSSFASPSLSRRDSESVRHRSHTVIPIACNRPRGLPRAPCLIGPTSLSSSLPRSSRIASRLVVGTRRRASTGVGISGYTLVLRERWIYAIVPACLPHRDQREVSRVFENLALVVRFRVCSLEGTNDLRVNTASFWKFLGSGLTVLWAKKCRSPVFTRYYWKRYLPFAPFRQLNLVRKRDISSRGIPRSIWSWQLSRRKNVTLFDIFTIRRRYLLFAFQVVAD